MEAKYPYREVRTARLLLRPLSSQDVDDIFAIRSSADVMKYTPSVAETNVQQSVEWMAKCLGRDDYHGFSVELLGSEKEATELDPKPRRRVIGVVGAVRGPEVGYMFHTDSWGKGMASEAMAAYMPLFWEHFEGRYDYASAMVDPENIASQKILERLGFTVYDHKKQDFVSPNIGVRDTLYYRVFRPGMSIETVKIHE